MEFKPFRVQAHNTAAAAENKIHDDRVAARYGFRGGLVPGVTVYGYMVPAVLECLGRPWLERGRVTVRFQAPFYEGDWVISSCDGAELRAEREDGSLCASGQVSIADGVPADYPRHPLPEMPLPDMDHRPPVAMIQAGLHLGTLVQVLDVREPGAIPERLLWMANTILVDNFQMGPWIHVASEVQHHRLAQMGEEIAVRGLIQECFERKGRKFAVAALGMSGAGGGPLASVRHTFIYGLEPDTIEEL
jgi:hypothetical protein